jgi:Ca2+-binding RTX toxin-like protein
MAIISSDVSVASGPALSFSAEFSSIIVKAGVAVENTGPGQAVSGAFAHTQLINHGTIVGNNTGAVYFTAADCWLVNSAAGLLLGGEGVRVQNADFRLANSGMIVGSQLAAVYSSGARAEITNALGGSMIGEKQGIQSLGNNLSVVNDGIIRGSTAAIETSSLSTVVNTDSGSIVGRLYGMLGGADLRLRNDGDIRGETEWGVSMGTGSVISNSGAIYGKVEGIYTASNTCTVYNRGSIEGGTEGIEIKTALGAVTSVFNTGEISSGLDAILISGSGAIRLYNSGILNGNLTLAGAHDFVRNSGDVNGNVSLGNGNDMYRGRNGSVDGVLDGGAGNDWMMGGNGDTVTGGLGNDLLLASGAACTLVGGAGADDLRAGEGADSFNYRFVNESTAAVQDVIRGFSYDDVIDLSGIDANAAVAGNQSFAYLEEFAFSGVARPDNQGELRLEYSSGGVLIQGDVNADGVADFQIRVENMSYLYASEFVL